jgi:hypothetical protein
MFKPGARVTPWKRDVVVGIGGGGRQHLMLSVCIDVRPARLVESAAAPSEPMPFELRGSEREGAAGG